MPITVKRRKSTVRKKKTAQKRSSRRSGTMTYAFGPRRTDGRGSDKQLLGGKGANLAEMTTIGLPVPPGFTITTDTCAAFDKAGGKLPPGLMDEVRSQIGRLEKETGKRFGDSSNPLLVSVRSGAAVSMPGMMDTVLNLGLNDKAVKGLTKVTENERFALDAFRRLINMFGDVVMDVDHHLFEAEFAKIKRRYKTEVDADVPVKGMQSLCEVYKKVYRSKVGKAFPQDPYKQLALSIEAVFKSWNSNRAIRYRQINEITGLIGTAVNVQVMVFGNMGDDSGTGVGFTRDPSTGENKFFGEFLINAQGEDVVAGIRTPKPLAEMKDWNRKAFNQLMGIKKILEDHYHDMQDIEFTIERERLFMLQTRNGKRTGAASLKIAVDMVREKRITRAEALGRVAPDEITQLLLPSFSPEAKKKVKVLATGLPASPGASTGTLAFTAEEAVARTQAGESVLLVRNETSPEDVDGMHHAAGILTSTGGMTSHAAVVARGWGKCCVAGAGSLRINEKARTVKIDGKKYNHKSVLSIDGSTGEVMEGEVATRLPQLSGDFSTIMRWSDDVRRLKVRTNADTPADAKRARDFGAQGIGLCRTEHMFFEGDRIKAMREMIMVEEEPARRRALKKLLPFQRRDFVGIFTAMKGLPVTIRLLDPPLHEFLPREESTQKALAKTMGMSLSRLRERITELHEFNPMLGHRGCRLVVTYPEILEMQVTAIVEAMIVCKKKRIAAIPEIMIPLVGMEQELAVLRSQVEEVIARVKKAKKFTGKLDIPIGTMIEIPRAALTAGDVAQHADFFSFGTNDLTQLTYGFSRDDIGTFLPEYIERGLLERDPFQSIDVPGVGQLVSEAVLRGRAVDPTMKLGVCGEHGGDPASIRFFDKVGLDYVSCSPFRVPIARLVAAQSTLEQS